MFPGKRHDGSLGDLAETEQTCAMVRRFTAAVSSRFAMMFKPRPDEREHHENDDALFARRENKHGEEPFHFFA